LAQRRPFHATTAGYEQNNAAPTDRTYSWFTLIFVRLRENHGGNTCDFFHLLALSEQIWGRSVSDALGFKSSGGVE